jgi:hypothetical protein
LLNADAVKDMIARGVASGHFAYVGKSSKGAYDPFNYASDVRPGEVEVSDEMFIISKETALKYKASGAPSSGEQPSPPQSGDLYPSLTGEKTQEPTGEPDTDSLTKTTAPTATLKWTGEVTPQKWMNFYTKVLSRFAAGKGLKLTVSVEASPEDGVSSQKVEETKVALRELGLKDDVRIG